MSLYKSIIGVFLQNHLRCCVRVVGSIINEKTKKEIHCCVSLFLSFLHKIAVI